MKLLVVSPYMPSPTWGFSARSYYLLKMLATMHTVSLLTLVAHDEVGADGNIPLVQDFVETMQVISRPQTQSKRARQLMSLVGGRSYSLHAHSVAGMQETLDKLLSKGCYDAVLFESVLTAAYRLPKGVKVIIDEHNIEYELLQRTYERETDLLRRWYNWRESRLLKSVEIARCGKADLVLVTSEREHVLLKSMLPQKMIEVVPNGVDIAAFQVDHEAQEVAHSIIFTGTMDYYPNIDAVLFFAERCWPLIRARVPDATWQIVGRNPPLEIAKLAELPGVKVTGWVPDVRPYLAAASVAIAPLLIGSGTRLKILEALAMAKAVVSTSLGCEGLSVVPGKHLMVADQPEAFAQAVVDFLLNPARCNAFGSAGRALAEAEYSWEQCGIKLLHALDRMC